MPHRNVQKADTDYSLSATELVSEYLYDNTGSKLFRQIMQMPEYNPLTGDVKNFLISVKDQDVNIALLEQRFHFYRWEPVFMELSRKYDLSEIYSLAGHYNFKVIENFTDRRLYFTDTLWIRE